MKIEVIKKGGVIEVPSEGVLERLGEVDAAKLRVLLYALSCPELLPDEACEKIDVTKKSLAAALDYWEKAGVLKKVGEKKAEKSTTAPEKTKISDRVSLSRPKALPHAEELPRYSSEEIASFISSHSEMQELLRCCQQYMGKMFNVAEVEVVVGLTDYLKLDDEYILLLFSHCQKMGKKSLRYVEKLAVGLFDDGILAYDELDEHLKMIEETAQLDRPIRKLFGIGRRTLTKKEKESFENWCGRWHMPFELIEKAFEITVENTGNASVAYCNAVLEKWHSEGITELDGVETALNDYRHDKDNARDSGKSFETDDFFEAALKRSYNNEDK